MHRLELTRDQLLAQRRERLPLYMVPSHIVERDRPLPRNPDGKIDRRLLASELASLYQEVNV